MKNDFIKIWNTLQKNDGIFGTKQHFLDGIEKMVDKHWYYIKHKDRIIQNVRDNIRTKDDLYNEIYSLYKRIANLKLIIEHKDEYIEELKQYIINIKKDETEYNI